MLISNFNIGNKSFEKTRRHLSLDVLFLGFYIIFCPISTALSGIIGNFSLLNYLAIIYCVFAATRVIAQRKVSIKRNCIFVYLYLLYALLSFVWNSYFSFNWYFVTYLFTFAIVTLSSLFDYTNVDFAYLNKCIIISLVVSLVVFLVNFNNRYAGRIMVTITSTMDPNDFGGGLSIILCFLLFEFLKTKKYIVFIPISLVGFMIVMTGSRGSLLMFFFAVITCLFLLKGRERILVLATLIVLIILYFLFERFLPQEIVERLSFKELLYDQGSGRLGIWKAAFNRYAQFGIPNLIFGSGHGSFAETVGYYPGNRITPYQAHNLFVNELIEGGIVGEILLLSCLANLLLNSYKNKNFLGFMVVVCFIIEGLSLDVQSFRVMAISFALAVIPDVKKQNIQIYER